jgi:protein-L-isoaspartate O-methyltransferase
MVIPVGGEQEQQLLLVARVKTGIETETVCPVVFVKLIGKEGYAPSSQ